MADFNDKIKDGMDLADDNMHELKGRAEQKSSDLIDEDDTS